LINTKSDLMMSDWSSDHAKEFYNIKRWGEGYFDINEAGQVVVTPYKQSEINLSDLTKTLEKEGLKYPILIRFNDILKNRFDKIHEAYQKAMSECDYEANYTLVYPIKVNQQRRIIEELKNYGQDNLGLEAGSKAELLAIISILENKSLIVCNGYKDQEYIRMALIAQEMGHEVNIIIEKLSEIKTIHKVSKEMNVKPSLGLRVRLATIGKGNWQNSGGEKSKFGLTASQVLELIDFLKNADMLEQLKLLHFHMGSQITDLEDIKNAMSEATQYFVQLHKLDVNIETVNAGGGLAIDYQGTSNSDYLIIMSASPPLGRSMLRPP